MGWRRQWPEKMPRPEVKSLSSERKERILESLENGIVTSPVLSALSIRVRALRGRFYLERLWPNEDEQYEIEVIGRITPLTTPRNRLLLEVEKSHGNWCEITHGEAQKLINAIANDIDGTFHGLGVLNKSLSDLEEGVDRFDVTMDDDLRFIYKNTGEMCSVQESLFHFFGLPIDVIAEPRHWYQYHRKPEIVEVSEDYSRILVTFSSMSMSGSHFHGTCLYAKIEGLWEAFTIKPNMSHDIATAILWLEKRNWISW
jgi:hypothetical protein